MSTYLIQKRAGHRENFTVSKVKNVIAWGCENLNVDRLKLESTVDDFMYDGIPSTKIHESIIHHASALASADETDWVVVAGRLETMKRWKESKFKENNFYDFFFHMMETGKYAERLFGGYTKKEIKQFSKMIVPDRDLEHSYGSALTAKSKYLLEDETIQYMHMGNAMAIASVESSGNRVKFVEKVYTALSERKISLATPWLSNLRSGGNISSCFIIAVDDSMDSLVANWGRAAFISKNGGGLGVDLARIRAKGAPVDGRPASSGGVLGWTKIFNDIAVNVDQGGKRAGAFTVHIPIWHRDLEDFLEIQSEVGDQRKKAHDIFPQVGVYDVFMEIQQAKGAWHTFCPHEVETVLGHKLYAIFGEEFKEAYLECVQAYHDGLLKNVGEYSKRTDSSARDIVKHMMRTQYETGLPYVAFLDRINETNPNKHDGHIPCVNLCTESFSNVVPDKYGHTCNLASPVVGRLASLDEAVEIAALTTHILDNGIELTTTPNDINAAHNDRYRTIGVGIQGLHDYLVRNFSNYSNIAMVSEITEALAYGCVKKSVELAEERGAYPAFKGSRWDTGEQIQQYKDYTSGNFDWTALQDRIDVTGIRNSQTMSPAPNTSTSIFMDAAAGVMPVYAAFFREDNSSGKFPISAMHLHNNPLGYSKTFNLFDQTELARTMGAMQKFIDTGVSAEFIFDQNKEGASALELYNLINEAWESGMKAIYYIRSIKKGSDIEDLMGFSDSGCVGCAG